MPVSARRRALATAVAVLLTACGSANGGAESVVAAASDFAPTLDGFAFPNFGAGNSTESMSPSDLALMFGDGVCTSGSGESCTPSAEGAAWIQMVNASRTAGHCEGMVVLAADRFVAAESPESIRLTNDAGTTHAIIRAFATQFLPEVEQATTRSARDDMRTKIAAVAESITSGGLGWTVGLYEGNNGHSLLPYSVQPTDADHVRMKVYDSNWPGKNRWIDFDLGKSRWTFSFAGADPTTDPAPWTGDNSAFDITPASARRSGSAPFSRANHVKGTYLVVKSSAPDWSIATTAGDIGPGDEGVIPIRSGGGPADYLVHVVDDAVAVTTPSSANVYAITGTSVVRIESNGAGSPVRIDDAKVSVLDASTTVSVASSERAVTVGGGPARVDVSGTTLSVVPQGTGRSIVVDQATGNLTVSISNASVHTSKGSAITEPDPVLPPVLSAPDTRAGLPSQVSRSITAGQPGPTVSTTSTSTTASVPSTTTSSPRSSTTTSVPSTVTPVLMNAVGAPTSGQVLPVIKVWLKDAAGQRINESASTVSVTLESSGGGAVAGATLAGTVRRTANAGEALFDDLVISGPSVSYRLRFTTGAISTVSPVFVLSP